MRPVSRKGARRAKNFKEYSMRAATGRHAGHQRRADVGNAQRQAAQNQQTGQQADAHRNRAAQFEAEGRRKQFARKADAQHRRQRAQAEHGHVENAVPQRARAKRRRPAPHTPSRRAAGRSTCPAARANGSRAAAIAPTWRFSSEPPAARPARTRPLFWKRESPAESPRRARWTASACNPASKMDSADESGHDAQQAIGGDAAKLINQSCRRRTAPAPPGGTGSASISGPHMAAQCRLPSRPSAKAIPKSILFSGQMVIFCSRK